MLVIRGRCLAWIAVLVCMASNPVITTAAETSEAAFRALRETRPPGPTANEPRFIANTPLVPRVLIAGDSWAQYMWDDGSHNDIFDKFGHGEKRAVGRSLGSDPGPGYGGPEYTISGSQARHWVDTANYPWIANMVSALQSDPSIDLVVLSIGGNDVLAGKDSGGWYKDMDLDVPGSEEAFFAGLEQDTFTIVQAALAVRPDLRVMISSYDFPNFNVGFWCFLSACPLRRNLSRDPDNDLISDAEINAMLVQLEQLRIGWVNSDARILYDNSNGLMHFYYGDGVSGPAVLPHPGQIAPDYLPMPGGNPQRPSLRSNFRRPNGIDADPIHLDYEGYQFKITNETQATFFPEFRAAFNESFVSEGSDRDGWTDGTTLGTEAIRVGADGSARRVGILSFDTTAIPDGSTVTGASLYLIRQGASGSNPFVSGSLGVAQLDIVSGSFGGVALEPGDATAAAHAVDAGIVCGSAVADGYAVRVDFTASALSAVHTGGTTQLRVAFPGTGAGTGNHEVAFADGDATAPMGAAIPDLSDFMGSAAPFLDVAYEAPTDVARDRPASPRPALSLATANPFTASVTLVARLQGAGRAHVALYDVRGRKVRTLLDATLPEGLHAVPWDGADTHGRQAPPGVYWAKLTVGSQVRTRRLVRLGT